MSGGYVNEASGRQSAILGGQENKASGEGGDEPAGSTVTGGFRNVSAGRYSSILGGKNQLVETEYGHFP